LDVLCDRKVAIKLQGKLNHITTS